MATITVSTENDGYSVFKENIWFEGNSAEEIAQRIAYVLASTMMGGNKIKYNGSVVVVSKIKLGEPNKKFVINVSEITS